MKPSGTTSASCKSLMASTAGDAGSSLSLRRVNDRRSNQESGFTIIELLTVVTIIATLLSLTSISLGDVVAGRKVRSTTDKIFALLMEAKSEATKRNTSVKVSIADPFVTLSTATDQLKQIDISGARNGLTVPVSSITFNSLGMVADAVSQNIDISHQSYSCAQIKCLRVEVLGGGLIKLCDPSQGDSNDPAYCI